MSDPSVPSWALGMPEGVGVGIPERGGYVYPDTPLLTPSGSHQNTYG